MKMKRLISPIDVVGYGTFGAWLLEAVGVLLDGSGREGRALLCLPGKLFQGDWLFLEVGPL